MIEAYSHVVADSYEILTLPDKYSGKFRFSQHCAEYCLDSNEVNAATFSNSGRYGSFLFYKFKSSAGHSLPFDIHGPATTRGPWIWGAMASWILIAALVSAFAAFRLRIGAFAFFVAGVVSLVLVVQIATGTPLKSAFAWMLLLTGGMQLGYTAGVVLISIFLHLSTRTKSAKRRDHTSGT
jgi:hypothetical protein